GRMGKGAAQAGRARYTARILQPHGLARGGACRHGAQRHPAHAHAGEARHESRLALRLEAACAETLIRRTLASEGGWRTPLQCRIWLRNSFVRSCLGWSKNSTGVFCSTICPASMKITRLATLRAKPISCVTLSMVMPSSARPTIFYSTSFIFSVSSAEV